VAAASAFNSWVSFATQLQKIAKTTSLTSEASPSTSEIRTRQSVEISQGTSQLYEPSLYVLATIPVQVAPSLTEYSIVT